MTAFTTDQRPSLGQVAIREEKVKKAEFSQESKRYSEGLEDVRWKQLRQKVLDRDRHSCRSCSKTEGPLQVHHRQYHRCKRSGEWRKPWEYHPVFLVTLCEECHVRGHQQFSIPIKDI